MQGDLVNNTPSRTFNPSCIVMRDRQRAFILWIRYPYTYMFALVARRLGGSGVGHNAVGPIGGTSSILGSRRGRWVAWEIGPCPPLAVVRAASLASPTGEGHPGLMVDQAESLYLRCGGLFFLLRCNNRGACHSDEMHVIESQRQPCSVLSSLQTTPNPQPKRQIYSSSTFNYDVGWKFLLATRPAYFREMNFQEFFPENGVLLLKHDINETRR